MNLDRFSQPCPWEDWDVDTDEEDARERADEWGDREADRKENQNDHD